MDIEGKTPLQVFEQLPDTTRENMRRAWLQGMQCFEVPIFHEGDGFLRYRFVLRDIFGSLTIKQRVAMATVPKAPTDANGSEVPWPFPDALWMNVPDPVWVGEAADIPRSSGENEHQKAMGDIREQFSDLMTPPAPNWPYDLPASEQWPFPRHEWVSAVPGEWVQPEPHPTSDKTPAGLLVVSDLPSQRMGNRWQA